MRVGKVQVLGSVPPHHAGMERGSRGSPWPLSPWEGLGLNFWPHPELLLAQGQPFMTPFPGGQILSVPGDEKVLLQSSCVGSTLWLPAPRVAPAPRSTVLPT